MNPSDLGTQKSARFLVTGGRQTKTPLRKLARFEKAIAATINLVNGQKEAIIDYVSDPNHGPPTGTDMNFTAGSVREDEVIISTTTEVLIFDRNSLSLKHKFSNMMFNDVHHVVKEDDGTFLVAVTGLDCIARLDGDGRLIQEWSVLADSVWNRFDRNVDYRKLSTKPHASHPNFVIQLGNQIWATRFNQKDVVCVTDPSNQIEINIEKPHDGVVFGGSIYFTVVSGFVVEIEISSLRIVRVYDLNQMNDTNRALGWCRGIACLGNDEFLIGFSRLRPTVFRNNIEWVSRQFFSNELVISCLPTRVTHYNLKENRILKEFNMEEMDISAIFSILQLD